MARPFPTKDSTLKDIILYVLEARGEIADTELAMRHAATTLSAGKIAPWPAITLNYMLGKRPQTTREEIKKAGWEHNLRKASRQRFLACKALYDAQLKLLAKDAETIKPFQLPETFAATVLAMIGGKDNIHEAAQRTGIPSVEMRDFAVNGRIPVTKESIDSFIEKLEHAYPDEAWLSPLLRVFAEKNMTVSQAKQGKKANVELFRQAAREILIDVRCQMGLLMSDVEKRMQDAIVGKLKSDDAVPQALTVARVALGKVRAFEAGDTMSASVFVSCIRSFSTVMYLERNNPKQHKLLGFLANAIR